MVLRRGISVVQESVRRVDLIEARLIVHGKIEFVKRHRLVQLDRSIHLREAYTL